MDSGLLAYSKPVRQMTMSKIIIYFDKDDHPVAEGKNYHDLARKLGITPAAVCFGVKRGSDRYMVIEKDEDAT